MSSIEGLFDRYGPSYRWFATGTVMIATIAVVLSTTIVNVAIPDVMGAFGISQVQAQWLSTGFLAAMTATMLVTDWADRAFGQRATMVGALAIFMPVRCWAALRRTRRFSPSRASFRVPPPALCSLWR